MAYNSTTDFLALWRNIAGVVSKLEMPGMDYVIEALARAGVVNVTVSATAPVANQATTAWLKAAVPSYSAEGALFLWDPVATAYAAATPALFLAFLYASAGDSGVSWWTSTGGPPLNTVGSNGDFAARLDTPNGIYGPKAVGVWPATPIPGTTDTITSTALDNTFGASVGQLLYRGALTWQALPIGTANAVLAVVAGLPTWDALSTLLDAVFANSQGSILFRSAGAWQALPPGVAAQVLSSGGPGADVLWSPRTAEFPSGTTMLFQQTAAPTGWTKQTAIDDYGLRVVAGAAGTVAGTAFSTVFAQTAVGNTTLSTAQMPSHTHSYTAPTAGFNAGTGAFAVAGPGGAASTGGAGSGGSHTHSVSLSLSYVDVIIASKN